jgi:hypothetical protein
MTLLSKIRQKLRETILSKPRDFALRKFLGKKLNRYCEILDLHIDEIHKLIHLTVRPKGEEEPIEIEANYKVKEDNDSLTLSITKVRTSREWLTLLANDFLPHSFEGLPKFAKIVL